MDERRRALARLAAHTTDPALRARHLAEELRAGGLLLEQLELMACVGDEAAAQIVVLGPVPHGPRSPGGLRQIPGDDHVHQYPPKGGRALGLWIEELYLRFGLRVGVRAGLAGFEAWSRGAGADLTTGLKNRLGRVRAWLEAPSEERAHALRRSRSPKRNDAAASSLGELSEAITLGRSAPLVRSVWRSAEALVALGASREEAESRIREAVRADLVPWALATREIVTDPDALRERALAVLDAGHPDAARELAERALAPEEGRTAPNWLASAEARLASGDARGALGDVERAFALRPPDADPLRIRGLVRDALGERRLAVVDLTEFLNRVMTRVTEVDGSSRLIGPRGWEAARDKLERLGAPWIEPGPPRPGRFQRR